MIIIAILLIFFFQPIKASNGLYEKLKSITGVYVKQIETLEGYKESYELAIVQPVDHNNPDGPKFTQRVFLSHKDYSKPVVFETNGYGVNWEKNLELSTMLNANQIIVEHRYYDASKPKALNWKYLTVWQAASDHHRIINLLKNIYQGKWVSTGRSKGGMASLFLENYYPDDIDATVAFVAPIFNDIQDQRFISFLNQRADSNQIKRLKNFQISCLEKRDSMLILINKHIHTRNIEHTLSLDSILEWSILEFPTDFWSSNLNPDNIPNKNASCKTLFNYLNSVSNISNLGDFNIKSNYPLTWQIVTEFGYYAYDIDHLKSILKVVKEPDKRCFAPKTNYIPEYNPDIMKDILFNLQNNRNNIIYLYGANDTWTAGKVDPKETTNSIQVIVEGFPHKFGIKDLPQEDINIVLKALNDWIYK